jgi:hypothetical protein
VVDAFEPWSASDAVLKRLRAVLAQPDLFSGALFEEAKTKCRKLENCARRLKHLTNGQASMGDDLLASFEHESDTRRFLDAMRERPEIERAAMNRDLIAMAFPQIGDSPQFGRRPLIAFLLLLGLYVVLAVALNFQLGRFVFADEPPAADVPSSVKRGLLISGTLVGLILVAIVGLRSASFLFYLVFDTPSDCSFYENFTNESLGNIQWLFVNAVPVATVYLKSQWGVAGWLSVPSIICALVGVSRLAARLGDGFAFYCSLPLLAILLAPAVPNGATSLHLFFTACLTWVPITFLFSFSLPYLRPLVSMPREWAPLAIAFALILAVLAAVRLGQPDMFVLLAGSLSAFGLWNTIRRGGQLRDAYVWLGLAICFLLTLVAFVLKPFGTFLDAVGTLESSLSIQQSFLAVCGFSPAPVAVQPDHPVPADAYRLEIAIVSCIGFFTTLSVMAAWAQRMAESEPTLSSRHH